VALLHHRRVEFLHHGVVFQLPLFLPAGEIRFTDKANLAVAALLGLCYALSSWQAAGSRSAGVISPRSGSVLASWQARCWSVSQLGSAAGQIAAAVVVTLGMCFTWPVLEALISENETPARVPHAVGIYNITWAATNALAYFIGGTLIVKFGFHSVFYAPIALLMVQFALTVWLQSLARAHSRAAAETVVAPPPDQTGRPRRGRRPSCAWPWLANPFAYIAINTLIAVIPGLAARFELSPMMAGFICSLWCFVRLGVFFALWSGPAGITVFAGSRPALSCSFLARHNSRRAQSGGAGRGANPLRRGDRADLLFVAVQSAEPDSNRALTAMTSC